METLTWRGKVVIFQSFYNKERILIINLKAFLIQSIASLRYQSGNKYSTSFSFQLECTSSQHAEAKFSCLSQKNTNFILQNQDNNPIMFSLFQVRKWPKNTIFQKR